jgi:hypothetical protein
MVFATDSGGAMKAQVLAIAVLVAMFSGVSHADSCAAGLLSNLIGTSCTVGNETFTFSAKGVQLSTLTFAPLTSGSSAGFAIAGVPADAGPQIVDYFTAVPSSGMITSFTATLNGVSGTGSGDSFAFLQDNDVAGGTAEDDYIGGLETSHQTGSGTFPSGFGTGPHLGFFQIGNSGGSSFTSADFVFNESPSVTPEPATWLTFGTGLVGILGAMKRKLLPR